MDLTRPVSMPELSRDVCGLLADQLELPRSAVRPEHYIDELGGDSIVLLAVLDNLQCRYGIQLDLRNVANEAQARGAATVQDFCSLIAEFLT
jgi:acyl carrier protein